MTAAQIAHLDAKKQALNRFKIAINAKENHLTGQKCGQCYQ